MDASSDPDPLALTTTLRTRLAAGTYTVIVDTFGGGILEPFSLEAHAVPAATNATCATPTVVASQTTQRGQLDLASAPTTGCSGTTSST